MKFKIGDIIKPINDKYKEVVKINDIDIETKKYYVVFLTEPIANGWISMKKIDKKAKYLEDGNDILKRML